MRYLHEVLIPGLSELDEIRLNAVHPLVNLSVVRRLLLQIFLKTSLAIHNFTDTRFQLLIVDHDPAMKHCRDVALNF